MKRLTKKEQLAGNTVSYVTVEDCFDVWSVPKKFMGNAIDRLAAIEDILGDEYDLDRLSAMVNQRMTMREEVAERWELTCNIPLDRLRELAHADREGRIHIYRRSYKCPICGAYRLIPRVDRQFYFCFHCKSQVSREEAEAALRGEQE